MPQKLFLAGSGEIDSILESLKIRLLEKTGMDAVLCSTPEGLILPEQNSEKTDWVNFLPAIGAAYDGVAHSPIWFDFMNPQSKRTEKKKPISWKPFAFLTVGLLILGCGLWLSIIQKKLSVLQNLDNLIAQTQPNLDSTRLSRQYWNLFRSYLPDPQGGIRLSYLDILYEIHKLMPDTDDTYITDLVIIGHDRSSSAGNYDINITGRSSEVAEVVTEFIDRVNNSEMFQKAEMAKSLTRESGDSFYPISFSVTCNLSRNPVGKNKP